MNTPTKRIFYLFGPKFAKNEPQTKVWGSLTCKPQFSQPFAAAFAPGRTRSRRSQPVARVFALVAAVRRSVRSRLRALALFALVVRVRRSRLRARSRWSHAFALFAPVAAGCARVRAGRSQLRARSRWSHDLRTRAHPRRDAT